MKWSELKIVTEKVSRNPFQILGFEKYYHSAVMLPLLKKDGNIHVLFEVRSKQLKRQPGEVCFPGGRSDHEDMSYKKTAIRETCEELGLAEKDIEMIAPLNYLVTPFSAIIYPFVGIIHNAEQIMESKDEVEEVFTVPLAFFLSQEPSVHYLDVKIVPEKSFPFHLIENGEDYDWRGGRIPEYFYEYEGKVIWGLTARILHHFVSLLT